MVRGRLDPIAALKGTNRLYARVLANIDRAMPRHLGNPTERRVLLELLRHPRMVDSELATELGLDRSHLSRIIKGLSDEGFVSSEPTPYHQSQRLRFLTADGVGRAKALNEHMDQAVEQQFATLTPPDREMILRATGAASRDAFDEAEGVAVTARPIAARDFGWVLHQLGGVSRKYDAWMSLARASADIHAFLSQPGDPSELGWIAQRLGKRVAVCLMTGNETMMRAHISICFVTAEARGLGIDALLIQKAIERARTQTMLNLTANVLERNDELSGVLKSLGFKIGKSGVADPDFAPKKYREYVLDLPITGLKGESRPTDEPKPPAPDWEDRRFERKLAQERQDEQDLES